MLEIHSSSLLRESVRGAFAVTQIKTWEKKRTGFHGYLWKVIFCQDDDRLSDLRFTRRPVHGFNSQLLDECSRGFLMDTLSLKNITFWKMEKVTVLLRSSQEGNSVWNEERVNEGGLNAPRTPGITSHWCHAVYWSMTNSFLILKDNHDRSDWSKWMKQFVIGQLRHTYFWTIGVSGRLHVLSFVNCAVTSSAWQSHGKNRRWRRGNTSHYSVHVV